MPPLFERIDGGGERYWVIQGRNDHDFVRALQIAEPPTQLLSPLGARRQPHNLCLWVPPTLARMICRFRATARRWKPPTREAAVCDRDVHEELGEPALEARPLWRCWATRHAAFFAMLPAASDCNDEAKNIIK